MSRDNHDFCILASLGSEPSMRLDGVKVECFVSFSSVFDVLTRRNVFGTFRS